jgi:hypothetical protein
MTDLLDRLFGPENGTSVTACYYNSACLSSIPADHVHNWRKCVTAEIEYWECGLCLATRSYEAKGEPDGT